MKKKWKRLFIAALSLVLVISMMSAAFAESAENLSSEENGTASYENSKSKEEVYEAAIEDKQYEKLGDALKAAKYGDTIKLLTDIKTQKVILRAGNIDLNGKVLTVTKRFFLFGGSVIDNTNGTGLLKTNPDDIIDRDNQALAVYDSEAEGYRFHEMNMWQKKTSNDEEMTFTFKPVFNGGGTVAVFKDGISNNKLKIMVTAELEYNDGTTKEMYYECSEALVKQVYGSKSHTAFKITFKGADRNNIKSFRVNSEISSDCGVTSTGEVVNFI